MTLSEQDISRIVDSLVRELNLKRDQTESSPVEVREEAAGGIQLETTFNGGGTIIKAQTRPPQAEGTEAAEVAGMIDHTLLKPDALGEEIIELCREAQEYEFASVCVNPSHVPLCSRLLAGTPVEVCTVIGFPLGASDPAVKAWETRQAIGQGAGEVDMVINIGAVKDGDLTSAARDIQGVVQEAHRSGALVKVILETFLLTEQEKVTACLLAKHAGADFVKTSTGFSGGGATAEDIRLMRGAVGPELGVKASGGVRSIEDARRMIQAGANRIGASSGVAIVQGALESGGG